MKLDLKGWVTPTSIGVASFVAGLGFGYFFAKQKYGVETFEEIKSKIDNLDSKVDELQSSDVQLEFSYDDAKQQFTNSLQQAAIIITRFQEEGREYLDRNVDPELKASLKSHPSNEKDKHGKHEVVITPISNTKEDESLINVFTNDDDDGWDYDVEVPKRTPDRPYIIHRDEYFSNEMDLTQASLTFYVGDEILCDEQDVPVYNPEKVVGKIIFGHGSQDPSICYVRNEALEAEYEILIDHGFYQQEVLGETIENNSIKHSKRLLKFRPE